MATNVNKKFGTMWLYIILAILGAASAIFGLVMLFTVPGDEIPKIGALVAGVIVALWCGKKAIDKDKE